MSETIADGHKMGTAWGDDITEERQGELDALLVAWDAALDHGERRSPFDGVRLSGADVY